MLFSPYPVPWFAYHLQDLLGQRAVRALLGTGRQDGGETEQLADGGVRDHIIPVERGVEVASQLVEADLSVENEEKLLGISRIDQIRWHGEGCTESFLLRRSKGTAVGC